MFEENNTDNKYRGFVKDAKEYIKLQTDLLRLNLVEKMSKIISYLIILIIGLILGLSAICYFSLALVVYLQTVFHSYVHGFLLVGGMFILIFLLFLAFRKTLFVNPVIKKLSGILFSDTTENIDEDEDEE